MKFNDPGSFIRHWSQHGAKHFTTRGKPAYRLDAWTKNYKTLLASFGLRKFRKNPVAKKNLSRRRVLFHIYAKYKNEPWAPMGWAHDKKEAIKRARYYVKIGRGRVQAKVMKG